MWLVRLKKKFNLFPRKTSSKPCCVFSHISKGKKPKIQKTNGERTSSKMPATLMRAHSLAPSLTLQGVSINQQLLIPSHFVPNSFAGSDAMMPIFSDHDLHAMFDDHPFEGHSSPPDEHFSLSVATLEVNEGTSIAASLVDGFHHGILVYQ